MTKHTKSISDITGGKAPRARDIGDPINIEHIYDAYRLRPGWKAIVQLGVKVVWSNGLNNDTIGPDRLLECKDGNEYMDNYGYSVVIVDGRKDPPTAEAWHPRVDGVGFRYSQFNQWGDPTEIAIIMDTSEAQQPEIEPKVPFYPCEITPEGRIDWLKPKEGKFGFFPLRTKGGKKGVRGLPKYLELLDVIQGQDDILKAYLPYAAKQGLSHPVVRLEDNSDTNRAQVKSDFSKQPQKDRLVIISMKDELYYESPQLNAWDPWPILDWCNSQISKVTQMNKLMMSGDPGGMIATSETAISNWEANVKEEQVFHRVQFLPIWIALGGDEDTNFKDPAKPSFTSLMEGIKAIREGMEGIVAKEDIVRLMNERLELEDEEVLTVAEDEELMMGDDNSGGSSGDTDRSQTDQE